jgi:hypothetical protein
MVKMLQPRGGVPTICEKRVVELSNSVWTQLENNEWISFVPTSESITILCEDKAPIDVLVPGIGKLGIHENCKGFGRSAHFQTHAILNLDTPGYGSDFMSKVNLEYDCCEYLNSKTNLSILSLNASFKHIVSHLDDLKVASHKISDVEHLLKEQEWKRLHSAFHNTYSVLVYFCLFAIGLYIFYKLYNCLRTKVNCVKAIADTNGSGNVVNIKIHMSNESLAMASEDVPLCELTQPDAKPPRSNRLRTSRTCF